VEWEDGYRLSEEEILGSGPLIEGAASVGAEVLLEGDTPFRWKNQEHEGSVKLAVIRPCVSKGKKVRGLPPIYTEEMLAENAGVYSGWLMYMDHMTAKMREALQELLSEGSRSIRDLGGRVLRSWYDPNYTSGWDAQRNYKPGAVMAEALPQPLTRAMIETDSKILNVSHNCWPSGAVVGTKWGQKGAIIDGIRSTPEGSVDWVPRGGAGGQLAEAELEEFDRVAVSVLRRAYDSGPVTTWADITDPNALVEEIKSNAPHLLESLGGEDKLRDAISGKSEPPPPSGDKLSKAEVKEMISEALREQADDDDTDPHEIAKDIVAEREGQKELAEYAHALIEGAGLTEDWERDLKLRYAVLPSGPSQAIRLVEDAASADDDKSARDVLKEAIERDLRHAQKLIESVGGRVRVKGLSTSKPDDNADAPKPKAKTEDWLPGGVALNEGEKESEAVERMLREGMAR
jgi:hypothetical protein